MPGSDRGQDTIRIKRIYEPTSSDDGWRVLVDRIWPRGISKERAALDDWMKEIGPSTELRKWFGHEPARWPEFRRRYRKELRAEEERLAQLLAMASEKTLTLVFSAKDEERNQAVVLSEMLRERIGS